jgi:2-polyprenyl-3-methyl-5-hydroxy-6-metoxy-1,4-benzoquinol methylase
MRQAEIDQKNSEFWDTLCGTNDAMLLGITDRSAPSLKKFDDWFFSFYPYLSRYIPYSEMRRKQVLEVGLGYGSAGQKIAEAGAHYTGLDIVEGPVEMINYRLHLNGLNGRATVGSILDAPFLMQLSTTLLRSAATTTP